MVKPIVFISHSSSDKKMARYFASELRLRGIDVWIDHEQIEYGDSLLKKIETGLEQSTIILVLISSAFLSSKWCRIECEALLIKEINCDLIFVIPVLIEDCETPLLLARKRYFDLSESAEMSERLDELAKQIAERFNQSQDRATNESPVFLPAQPKETHETQKERVLSSLQKRLKRDFFVSGKRKGEFGQTRIPNESPYHDSIRERLKHKPHYYLTYWGWKAMPKLLPDLIKDWTRLTTEALKNRFDGKRWIEVDLEIYGSGPTLPYVRAETVRHSVKAAEILLLFNEPNIPSEIAWTLITDASALTTEDKGWKEFNTETSESSLWSSVYIFRFLSTIRNGKCPPEVPSELDCFIEKSSSLIQRTEEYLEWHWQKYKWKFGPPSYEVNAPVVLIEYAPFAQNELFTENVYEVLREFLTPAGRLINPNLGAKDNISEYILSIRLAYALEIINLRKKQADNRVKRLISWIVNNYSDEYVFDTCDITFLSELVTLEEI